MSLSTRQKFSPLFALTLIPTWPTTSLLFLVFSVFLVTNSSPFTFTSPLLPCHLQFELGSCFYQQAELPQVTPTTPKTNSSMVSPLLLTNSAHLWPILFRCEKPDKPWQNLNTSSIPICQHHCALPCQWTKHTLSFIPFKGWPLCLEEFGGPSQQKRVAF